MDDCLIELRKEGFELIELNANQILEDSLAAIRSYLTQVNRELILGDLEDNDGTYTSEEIEELGEFLQELL